MIYLAVIFGYGHIMDWNSLILYMDIYNCSRKRIALGPSSKSVVHIHTVYFGKLFVLLIFILKQKLNIFFIYVGLISFCFIGPHRPVYGAHSWLCSQGPLLAVLRAQCSMSWNKLGSVSCMQNKHPTTIITSSSSIAAPQTVITFLITESL